jgi:hypothetical protein
LKEAKGELPATTASMMKVPEDMPCEENEGTRNSYDSFSMEKPKTVTRSSTVPTPGKDSSKSSAASSTATPTVASTPTKLKPTTATNTNGIQTANASPLVSTQSISSEVTRRTVTSAPPTAQSNENVHPSNGTAKPQNNDQDRTGGNEADANASSGYMDNPALSNPNMINTPTPTTQNPKKITEAPASASAAPLLIPPLRQATQSTQNGATPGHRHSQSMNDFDPFRLTTSPTSNSLHQTETIPTVFLPASMSLSTLPPYAAPGTERVTVTSELDGTFMSPNPFVIPVAFGMAPHHENVATASQTASVGGVLDDHQQHPQAQFTSNGQATLMANGFNTGIQHQQFMVVPQVPQQQQFMAAYHYEHQQYPFVQNQVIAGAPVQAQQQQMQQHTVAQASQQQPSTQGSNSNPQHQFDPMARR